MKETAISNPTIEVVDEDWPRYDWQNLAEQAVAAVFAHPEILVLTSRKTPMEIALRLTSDAEVQKLNAQWRGKDKATNVLSFPMDPLDSIADAGQPVMLGDIVLSLGVCTQEAEERSITLGAHASHLIVHGVLHLVGFDHIEDEDAERMERIERELLQALGLHDPYAEESERH